MKAMRRSLSFLLVVCMLLSTFPVSGASVEYGTGQLPEVTDFRYIDAEGTATSLLNLEHAPSLTLGDSYVFSVAFSNPSSVDQVYITSSQGSRVDYLEADWNSEAGAFVTNGKFEESPAYIPGRLSVEFSTKQTAPDLSEPINWGSVGIGLTADDVTVKKNTPNKTIAARVNLQNLLGEEAEVGIDIAVDVFDAATDRNLNQWLGAYRDLSGMVSYAVSGTHKIYVDYSDPDTYVAVLEGITDNSYIKLILDDIGSSHETLQTLMEKLEGITQVASVTNEFFHIKEDADALRRQVSQRTSISNEERTKLYRNISQYEKDRQLFSLSMAVIPVVILATGGTGTASAMVLNALAGAINASASFFWTHRVGLITGCGEVAAKFRQTAHGTEWNWPDMKSNRITESGQYYFGDNILRDYIVGSDDGSPIHVGICLHGQGTNSITVQDGVTLTIMDCAYAEDEDGVPIGGRTTEIENNGGDVTVFSGKVDISSGGERNRVTVYGGTVAHLNTDNSEVSLLGGTTERVDMAGGSLHIDGGAAVTIRNQSGTIDMASGFLKGYDRYMGAVNSFGGTVTITGGTVTGEINCDENADLWIHGGYFQNAPIYVDSGKTEITYGDFYGSEHTLFGSGGETLIEGGNFNGVVGNTGTMTINDRTFRSASGNVETDTGLTINGRYFQTVGNDENISVKASQAIENQVAARINGGTFYSSGQNSSCITGYKPYYEDLYPAITEINGGNFYNFGGCCISNGAIMHITGGTFVSEDDLYGDGCIRTHEDGRSVISGGKFYGINSPAVYSQTPENTFLTNGTFQAVDFLECVSGGGCTLSVAADSEMDFSTDKYGMIFRSESGTDSFRLNVQGENGYTGGVRVYDDANPAGQDVPLSELSAYKFSHRARLSAASFGGETARYPVVLENTGNGAAGSGSYEAGQTVHISAGSKPGFIFDRWESNEVQLENQFTPNTSFVMPEQPVSITANWVPSEHVYMIFMETVVHGSISVSQSAAAEGTQITLTADPNQGYELENVLICAGDGTVPYERISQNQVTFVMPPCDIKVGATFKKVKDQGSGGGSSSGTGETIGSYQVSAADAEGGAVTFDSKNVSKGSTVTVTVIPDEGYQLESILVTDKYGNVLELEQKSETVYTFMMPASKVKVTATFKKLVVDPEPTAVPFRDVSQRDWYYDAVEFVYEQGMMSGVGEEQFAPEMKTSRAMVVTVLHRLQDAPVPNINNPFQDILSGQWYTDAILWATEAGIIDGYRNGQFGPEDGVTREQFALILYNYAAYTGGDMTATADLSGFADAGSVSAWAKKATSWAVGVGLLSGKGDGILDPAGTASRAEIAQMLMNYYINVDSL